MRLYSTPAPQLINGYLRDVTSLTGVRRLQLAHNPDSSYPATVALLCRAVRKLASVNLPEEV